MKKLISLLICLSIVLTTSLTLLSCTENSGEKKPASNNADTTTLGKDDPDPTPDPTPELTPEDMKITEGYTVVSQSSFQIKVTEAEKTSVQTARVATIKKADGEQGIYIDVLDDELKVKLFKIWRGRGIVERYSDDTLAIMVVNVNADKKLVMSTNLVKVTDKYMKTDGSFEQKQEVGFYSVDTELGTSLNGSVADSAAIRRYEGDVANFFNTTVNDVNVAKALKPDTPCVLLADSYSSADANKTYSDTEKVASIFDNEEFVSQKLTFDHVLSLYSISR